jgi:hypothetical protein
MWNWLKLTIFEQAAMAPQTLSGKYIRDMPMCWSVFKSQDIITVRLQACFGTSSAAKALYV